MRIGMFPLDFEQARQYVTEKLQDGHALAQEILKNIEFTKGNFFALTQETVDKTRIYDFKYGGILAANPLESVNVLGIAYAARKKATSVQQLAEYFKRVLRSGQCCLFEDVLHILSDPINENLKKYVLSFKEEIYLRLSEKDFSQEIAERLIRFADAQWYYMNILTKEEPLTDQNLSSEQIKNAALNTSLLAVGAYDMEGYIVWEKEKQ